MRPLSSFYLVHLFLYTLYITTLIIGPFTLHKHFILFGIPASCSVLLAPFPLLIIYLFTKRHGLSYGYKMIFQTLITCLLMACLFWFINCIPISKQSIVSFDTWHKTFAPVPKITLVWALVQAIAQLSIIGLARWINYSLTRNFSLHGFWLIRAFVLIGLVFVLRLDYIGVVSFSWEVFSGSIFWFILFCLFLSNSIDISLYVLNRIIRKNNSVKIRKKKFNNPYTHGVYSWLLAIFCLVILLTNVVVIKGFTIQNRFFTIGLLLYPFTFVCTDLISELYDRQKAQFAVFAGFLASFIMMCFLTLVKLLPTYKSSPLSAQIFSNIFSFTPGIVMASMLAYLVGQFMDIYLFDTLRMHTRGKYLWLRNNIATLCSQFIDTVIFALISWLIWSNFNTGLSVLEVEPSYWYQVSVNEYVGKVVLALLDTPLVYIGVRVLKKIS